MTQSSDFLAELAALAEKATAAPWHTGCQNDALFLTAGRPPALNNDYPWHDAPRVALAKMFGPEEGDCLPVDAETNAALIVLLRNNLPAILALGRERDALREAFDKPNDDLTFILGQPCFAFIRHAQVWRAAGHEIKTRAEDEQAFFIGRMLHHYFADQGNWRSRWNEEMDAVLKAAKQALEGGNQ